MACKVRVTSNVSQEIPEATVLVDIAKLQHLHYVVETPSGRAGVAFYDEYFTGELKIAIGKFNLPAGGVVDIVLYPTETAPVYNPRNVFLLFDDFETLDETYWDTRGDVWEYASIENGTILNVANYDAVHNYGSFKQGIFHTFDYNLPPSLFAELRGVEWSENGNNDMPHCLLVFDNLAITIGEWYDRKGLVSVGFTDDWAGYHGRHVFWLFSDSRTNSGVASCDQDCKTVPYTGSADFATKFVNGTAYGWKDSSQFECTLDLSQTMALNQMGIEIGKYSSYGFGNYIKVDRILAFAPAPDEIVVEFFGCSTIYHIPKPRPVE